MPEQLIPGVVFQPRAYQGMQKGINQLVDVIRPTLGPRPRVVAVENTLRNNTPELLDKAGLITRRIIQLPDRDADMGAMLIRQILWRQHDEIGDGTAAAAVIFQTVYNRGVQYVAAGGNAIQLRRYLERGMHAIIDELDRLTIQIEGKARLAQLAESLCHDQALAKLLGEILDIVGEYGQVDVQSGYGRDLERQYVEGMYWSSGVLSPYMLTDQTKLRTDLPDAAILISDLEIDDPRQLMPVLDMALAQQLRKLVIIANKLSETSIALLLSASREPGQFQVIAVRTPGLGLIEQADAMEDLAILTGGRRLIQAAGDTLRGFKVEDLGRARRVWSDQKYLGIIGGKSNPHALRAHIANLRAVFKAAEDPQIRTRFRQRIGKLMGGSATLVIGGSTEIEMTARQDLARGTAELLRLALRDGVLPGGGVALLACRSRLAGMLKASSHLDEQMAYRILIHALEEPVRTIASNAGFDGGTVVAQIDRAEPGCGFDVRSGAIVDMAAAGIYDLAAAQKAAIRGAVAGAATALTVDILVHKRNPEAAVGQL